MGSSTPVETNIGTLHGRDAIYLDRCTQTAQQLEFEGEINGALCSDPSRKNSWLAYRIRFLSVQAFEARELEICRWPTTSSFDEVRDSEWLRSLDLSARHKHYIISTYDFAYQIAATGFELEIINQRPF
ncbi:hypothetical protein F0U62_01205 [Cystobacter fuscus]|nr:hypothetical protein F0U62_01205 [Cystobacter fuscus]